MSEFSRPSWDEYFLGLAFVVSSRSRDKDTQHGAIIVDENNIIVATGYNSFIRNLNDDDWPITRPEKYQFMIHAEENALLNTNVRLRDTNACLYVTGKPCVHCLQRVIQSGIKKIVYANRQGSRLETEETNNHFNKLVESTGIVVSKVDYNIEWIGNFLKRF